jgi:subtilisin family serine protease
VLIRALIAGLAALAFGASPALGADPRRGEQWGLEMVKGVDAWQTSTGVGAVVAVIDTGVQSTHPDLGDRLLPGFDFVGDDPVEAGDEDEDPKDGDGHGTHVTGIVAANADNGVGIAGIAPGAKVLPIRVLDDNGEGYASDTIKAIDYAIDKGVHVINLSLGDYIPLQSALLGDPAYTDALERAVSQGIVVVIAAGNNGLPRCENPDVDGIVCVGAVGPSGQRSAFSSFGENVDLMAPGGSGLGGSSEDVLSTYKGSGYASVAGTSQATPHVAGVAALLVSLGVRGQDAAARIVATAADAGAPGTDTQYGAGIVDAAAAVAGLGTPPPPDPGDPDPPPAPPAAGTFTTSKSVRAGTIRRRGFRAKCKAVRPGPCRVAVRYRGRKIAGGRADVPAGLATRVTAPLNRRGKRTLKGLRRRIRVRMSVTLPGEAARTRRITVRR